MPTSRQHQGARARRAQREQRPTTAEVIGRSRGTPRALTRRVGTPLLATAFLALCVVPATFAAGFATPPADTPNLALAVLQPADMAPGADLGAQGYIKPPNGFTAAYVGTLTGASVSDGTQYLAIQDFVALGPDATLASNLFGAQQSTLTTKRGRRAYIRRVVASIGRKAHITTRDVTLGPVASLGIGSASFTTTLRIRFRGMFDDEVLAVFAEGDVYASFGLTGTPNETLPISDTAALANTIDAHIRAVLGPTGVTGSSGTT